MVFDPGKESKHILHRRETERQDFRILRIPFDCQLLMVQACHEIAKEARWKTRTLLHTRRFYSPASMIRLYKIHILSFIESGTPAIFHAARTHLAIIDRVQESFLRELGVSETDAMLHFHLAPLHTRRCIAVLGLIHRTVLGKGPPQFREWFILQPASYYSAKRSTRAASSMHDRQIFDPLDGSHSTLLARSMAGMIRVYNDLPPDAVHAASVKLFQRYIQGMLKVKLASGDTSWSACLSTHGDGPWLI